MAGARGKSGKRARLGRGLSAMIQPEVPVEVEARDEGVEGTSDNTSDNPEDGSGASRRRGGADGGSAAARARGDAGGGRGSDASGDGADAPDGGDGNGSQSASVEGVAHGSGDAVGAGEAGLGSGSGSGSVSVASSVIEVSVDAVVANSQQPREAFDQGALAELAASIKAHGVLQPVTVRRTVGGGYELIAGERRLRASKLAGLETVPAVVREADDKESAQLALLENIQREDLNPVERAQGFSELSRRHGMTQEEISAAVGVSRSAVANALRLLELPDVVLDMVRTDALTFGHAKVLLGVEDRAVQLNLAERCVDAGWSVRTLEREAERLEGAGGGAARGGGAERDARAARVVADLEDRISSALGTKVRVRTSGGGSKGRIEISFYDLDQFDGLLEKLGVSEGI